MKGKTHLVAGLATGLITYKYIDLLNVDINDEKVLFASVIGLSIGSLLPDIDHPRSTLSLKVRPISFITSKLFKHRGYTHSIVGGITMTLLLGIILNMFDVSRTINFTFLKSLAIGIFSHIFLDLTTHYGVELFYPFSKKRIWSRKFSLKGVGLYISEVIVMLLSIGTIYHIMS